MYPKEKEEQEIAKRNFRRFIPLSDSVRNGIVYIHPTQADETPLSDPVFIINLCHGIIPLKLDDLEDPPVQIIEYTSPVKQRRIVKAPMGTCPTSSQYYHRDLFNQLFSIRRPNEEEFHHAVSELIKNPSLLENDDICTINEEFEPTFTGEMAIYDERENCYRDITTEKGGLTVNKFVNTLTYDDDDGLYVLNKTTFRLQCHPPPNFVPYTSIPLKSRCMIMSEGVYIFKNKNPGKIEITIPVGTFISLIHPYEFVDVGNSQNSAIITSESIRIFVNFNEPFHLPENSQFIYHGGRISYNTFYGGECNNHISLDNIILINGIYQIYPYPIGLFKNGMITYEPKTDLLSCPYFIHYVNLVHQANDTETIINEIVKPAKSLEYHYYHRSVTATCSSIIAHYFSNCSTYYSYDFTCQAYQAIDDHGDITNAVDFEADDDNILELNAYAKGNKIKRKGKTKTTKSKGKSKTRRKGTKRQRQRQKQKQKQ